MARRLIMKQGSRPLSLRLLVARRLLLLTLCSLTIGLSALLSACNRPPYIWASEVPVERARPKERAILITSGDIVSLTVIGQAQMSLQYTVGADGTIAVPDIGSVTIAGKSPADAEKEIAERLLKILEQPRVSVVVLTRQVQVTMAGEVAGPGKVVLTPGDGVATAIVMAGGVTDFGNENRIFLIRSSEPQRIRFRLKDLVRGGDSAQRFTLQDGDLIYVE